jgi:hypothetical protein
MDVEFRGMMAGDKKNASQKVSEYREVCVVTALLF